MSVKNRIKDRDKAGRIKRKYTGPRNGNMNTPSWWTKLYMNRPKRRENRRLCVLIERGICPDELVFPVGNARPHIYYW